jgi:hypothetical protein
VEYHRREISGPNGASFIVSCVSVCISQSNSWVIAKFTQLWMQIGMSVIQAIFGAATTELALLRKESYERLNSARQLSTS